MPRTDWTASARRDLSQIADYIASVDHRPKVAERLIRTIEEKTQAYARQPEMGSLHDDLRDPFRFFVHRRYVVIYRVVEIGIVVSCVVDSARDLTRVFREV